MQSLKAEWLIVWRFHKNYEISKVCVEASKEILARNTSFN
jgi:hypothetical protein